MPPDLTIPSPVRRLRRPLGECLGFEAHHLANHVEQWRDQMPEAAAEWLDALAERLSDLAIIAHRNECPAGVVARLHPALAVIEGGRT